MRKLVLIIVVLLTVSSLFSYEPSMKIAMMLGTSPVNEGCVFKSLVPLQIEDKDAYLVVNGFFKNEGTKKGTDVSDILDEPYEWWNDTGDKVSSSFVVNVGFAYFFKKYKHFGVSGFLGGGSTDYFIQYKSTASDLYFYDDGFSETIIDMGFDIIYRKKFFVATIGATTHVNINFAVGLML